MSTRTMTRVPVLVYADDPVTKSGVEAQLRGRPGVELRELDAWRIDGDGLNGTNGLNGHGGGHGRNGVAGLDGTNGHRRSDLTGLNGTGGTDVHRRSGTPGANGHGRSGLNGTGSANGHGRSGTKGTNGANGTNGTNGQAHRGQNGHGHGSANGAGGGASGAGGTLPWSSTGTDRSPAVVAVVVVDEVDERAVRTIRSLARGEGSRVLVVAGRLDDTSVLAITEAGACGLLRRSEAVPERLVPAVVAAAAGEGTIPPDLLGRLLEQVGHLQRQVLSPRGLTFSGLTERELQVLRLVADGHDTAEIARMLAYSERTVKNIIHDVTSRLQLKNRSHAVAWAMRQGLL